MEGLYRNGMSVDNLLAEVDEMKQFLNSQLHLVSLNEVPSQLFYSIANINITAATVACQRCPAPTVLSLLKPGNSAVSFSPVSGKCILRAVTK